MSLNSLFNTLQDIADAPESTEIVQHPIETYLTNAIACMSEGLPNDFRLAYVKYTRSVSYFNDNVVEIDYKYIPNTVDDECLFEPADDLYPVKCIESIIKYYPSDNTNWRSFTIQFTPSQYEFSYSKL